MSNIGLNRRSFLTLPLPQPAPQHNDPLAVGWVRSREAEAASLRLACWPPYARMEQEAV
jgi:hypothetical protein